MQLEELKLSLCAFLGKPLIWIDNAIQLAMGDGTDIYLEYDADSAEIYFCGDIAHISRQRLAASAVSLLEANLLGQETGGSAVLAYDSVEEKLIVWDKLPLEGLSAEVFRDRFSKLYLARMHWSAKMQVELPDDGMADAPFHFPIRLRG